MNKQALKQFANQLRRIAGLKKEVKGQIIRNPEKEQAADDLWAHVELKSIDYDEWDGSIKAAAFEDNYEGGRELTSDEVEFMKDWSQACQEWMDHTVANEERRRRGWPVD